MSVSTNTRITPRRGLDCTVLQNLPRTSLVCFLALRTRLAGPVLLRVQVIAVSPASPCLIPAVQASLIAHAGISRSCPAQGPIRGGRAYQEGARGQGVVQDRVAARSLESPWSETGSVPLPSSRVRCQVEFPNLKPEGQPLAQLRTTYQKGKPGWQ